MNGRKSRSLESGSRSRSTSRRSNRPNLDRLYSAQAFDDHHVYPTRASFEEEEEEEEHVESQNERHLGDRTEFDKNSTEKANVEDEPMTPEEAWELDESPSEEKDEKADRDLEKVQSIKSKKSSRSIKDPNLVTWDGPEDPQNPKNWQMSRKWAATFVVSSFTFISPLASSIVAPAFGSIAADLHITNEVELQMTLSIFVLAYAIGPLFLAPISEEYGRVRVLQLSNLFFMCWNLGCGFAQTKSELILFRFLSGLGGSAALAIGGGVLSDCWTAEQRGKAISIYALAPLLGPAVGPIAGGFIAQYSTWRWAFWSTTIGCAFIQISGIFFLQETYAPKLLEQKAARLRKETGNSELYSEFATKGKLTQNLRIALLRPFRLLFTQPIIQVIAVYMAYLYGLTYLILSTFPTIWDRFYHESISIGGLNYISLGVGLTLGTQITAPINDRIYVKLKRKANDVGQPEFRIPLMFIGSVMIPIGMFWYAWSPGNTHWIMPNIGAAIFAAGSIVCFQCMQTYIIDAYTRYAASGVAAAVVLRSLAGFGFPLFAPYMYSSLGYDWGNSLLGFISIVVGIPAPFLFWYFGKRLRGRSEYATG